MIEYRYKVLEEVLISIAKDGSNDNIVQQLDKLTSDEIRKLRNLMTTVERTLVDKEYNELFADSYDNQANLKELISG
tara:strand:- start:631 stop:861 length:231 start_codon:yes stop_codon:yes gene_type:complete